MAVLGLLMLKHPEGDDCPETRELVEGVRSAIQSTRDSVRRPALNLLKTVLQASASNPSLLIISGRFIGICGPALDELATRTCVQNTQSDLTPEQLQEMTDAVRIALLAQTTAPAEQKAVSIGAALGVLLPMLSPNSAAGTSRATLHQTAFQVVMHFASSCASDFRVHLASLDQKERSVIETAMRTSAEAAARAAALAKQQQERLKQASTANLSIPTNPDFSSFSLYIVRNVEAYFLQL